VCIYKSIVVVFLRDRACYAREEKRGKRSQNVYYKIIVIINGSYRKKRVLRSNPDAGRAPVGRRSGAGRAPVGRRSGAGIQLVVLKLILEQQIAG